MRRSMHRSQARRRTDPFPFLLAVLIIGLSLALVAIIALDLMTQVPPTREPTETMIRQQYQTTP